MARKKLDSPDLEELTPGEAPALNPYENEGPPQMALVNQAPHRPSMVDRERQAEPIFVQQYEVQRDRQVSSGGSVTLLRAGKIVDERHYDVESLKSQGVQLRAL
jgi:hypothetical protein